MIKWLWATLLTTALTLPFISHPPDDSERLGMALEYFQSGKYHEALLLFEQLDKAYDLNPRYHGYMGVCYYYEWAYEEACKYLDEAIPKLDAFAPHERSVYYYIDGESHFQLQQYKQAIPYFEKALTVCFENEKGDIHYRLGMCHMFAEEWQAARDHYRIALDNYVALRNTPDMQARIYQTSHMMKGCEDKMKEHGDRVMVMGTAVEEASMPVVPNDNAAPILSQEKEVGDTVGAVADVEYISRSLVSPIILPTISFTVDSAIQAPTRMDMSAKIRPEMSKEKLVRDTIRREIPQNINIQDLYNSFLEVEIDEK